MDEEIQCICLQSNVAISTSWNPGRFTPEQYQVWLRQLYRFSEEILVLITLTEDLFAPTDKNIADFFIHCLKNNYFNIIEVSNLYVNSTERYCTCNNSCLYLDGKLSFNCLKRSSNLALNEFYDERVPDDERYTQIQLKKALNKKECYTCECFSFCRNFCMASMLHKDYDAECSQVKHCLIRWIGSLCVHPLITVPSGCKVKTLSHLFCQLRIRCSVKFCIL